MLAKRNSHPHQMGDAGYAKKELNPEVETTHHAVLLIEFGGEAGKNFWMIKNNWGKQWGDAGFAKVARPSSLTGKSEMMKYLIDDIG